MDIEKLISTFDKHDLACGPFKAERKRFWNRVEAGIGEQRLRVPSCTTYDRVDVAGRTGGDGGDQTTILTAATAVVDGE